MWADSLGIYVCIYVCIFVRAYDDCLHSAGFKSYNICITNQVHVFRKFTVCVHVWILYMDTV